MRSSIPSVDGQMWCGSDVNGGGLTRLRFRNGAIADQSYTEANDWPKTVPMLFMRAAMALVGRHANVRRQQIQRRALHHLHDDQRPRFEYRLVHLEPAMVQCGLPHLGGAEFFFKRPMENLYSGRGLPSPEVNCLFEDFIRNSLEWNVCWSCLFCL